MRFPHLYGPLPVAAVTSVLPYRPGPDGRFVEPVGVPAADDALGRALAFERSLAERRAAAVLPVTGGVACVDPRVPASWEHNSLWVWDELDAASLAAEADRVLDGCAHRRVVTRRPPPEGLGWEVEQLRVQVFDAGAPDPLVPPDRAVVVTQDVMAGIWAPSSRRDHPGIDDAAVGDLLRRESFANAHARIVDLAVLRDDGVPVAGTQLRIDGATAAIEAVLTEPSARGRGHARALVGDAVVRARAAGCDVIFLLALADDWPRHWYTRMGFVDVGCRWEAVRPW
jgi:GNAT superfamily N-acetyltransferase